MSTVIDVPHNPDDSDALIAPASTGPCTKEQARDLVNRAATAAVAFEDAMAEIFRRQAWIPLGYNNPKELLLTEFKQLINPKTGKPYGRAHIYRMARLTLFLYEVAAATGVDVGELDIAEKALRAARENGVDDVIMLEQIEQKVLEAGPTVTADQVQDIVSEVIDTAAGRRVPTPPSEAGQNHPELDTGTDPVPGDQLDWSGPDNDSGGDRPPAREKPGPDVTGDPLDPFGSFGEQLPGSAAPEGGMDWGAAVAAATAFIDFTKVLRTISDMGGLLPQISDVETKLPEFLDACDDSELGAFSEALTDVDDVLKGLPQVRAAIEAIQGAVIDRAEE